MAIPETYDLVLPLLEIIKDKDEYKVQANTYLKKAELIESNRFMYFNITEEGLRLLDENPDKITEEDLMEYDGFREYKKVFIHDDTKDLDINELNPTDALRESFKKQMESVQKEIEDDMKEENKKAQNKKYFQSKEYADSNKVFGIKADREKIKDKEDDDEEYSKCHHKKHKHGKGKGKCHHKHDKDKCRCHKHGHGKCKCHRKKVVFNIEFSPAEELLNYAKLLEKGYLTKEEFEKKKEELLNIEYKI